MPEPRMSELRDVHTCPLCSADLRAGPIDPPLDVPPDELPDDQRYYSAVIGVVIPEVYDGILYWMCPACNGKWHRFPEGHRLHRAAQRYILPA